MSETLLAVCETLYFPLNIRIRCEDTRTQYRIALRHFGRFLGHDPTLADLQDDLITAWMTRRLDAGISPTTVREQAGRVQSLWTWLAKRRKVDAFPTFVKPDSPEGMPYALSIDQLGALFRSAAKERGSLGGVPADIWWTSFLGFVWCTAERKSAAMQLRYEWLNLSAPEAKAVIPAGVRKGRKKAGCYDLWPELVPLLVAVSQAGPTRDLIWPFPLCQNSFYTRYDRILKDAGIPVSRRTKTHSLRVSHATWRTVFGGDATRQLMHSDPAVTLRHYIDRSKLPSDGVRMPIPW
jgi:integrase